MSRQRDWQRKRVAAGKCKTCGKKRKNYAQLCDDCAEKARNRSRVKSQSVPWQKGGRGRPPKGAKR